LGVAVNEQACLGFRQYRQLDLGAAKRRDSSTTLASRLGEKLRPDMSPDICTR